jgi:hypothetical protein
VIVEMRHFFRFFVDAFASFDVDLSPVATAPPLAMLLTAAGANIWVAVSAMSPTFCAVLWLKPRSSRTACFALVLIHFV